MWMRSGLWLFFFNDTATTEIYTLSLHDALPISRRRAESWTHRSKPSSPKSGDARSEEHTSELQSPCNLVCRLLLAKKTKTPHYAQPDMDQSVHDSSFCTIAGH